MASHSICLRGPWQVLSASPAQIDEAGSANSTSLPRRFKFDRPLPVAELLDELKISTNDSLARVALVRGFNWPAITELDSVKVILEFSALPAGIACYLNGRELQQSSADKFEVTRLLQSHNTLELRFTDQIKLHSKCELGTCCLVIIEQ